ncbi:hypothetical protein N657DRAFT_38508 [Parathielavia appendiculata]|uniref:Uncharacterized protein n=1 Tax=Parathielavia appendiculata TaxID=2587402 RepID=A0AAN6U9Q5_9PEZI|nr:hypothetical protein N657DRAFT_38508 [Parathielavia appendiculata]
MARKKKVRSIVQEFDDYFGTGTLEDWQRLCHDVGLEGYYGSITQCRKALRTVHVNIRDLLEAVKQGEKPRRFASAAQLVAYTVNTRKFYPLSKVKEMGPVKVLLRNML